MGRKEIHIYSKDCSVLAEGSAIVYSLKLSIMNHVGHCLENEDARYEIICVVLLLYSMRLEVPLSSVDVILLCYTTNTKSSFVPSTAVH